MDVYPHMPILRVARAHAQTMAAQLAYITRWLVRLRASGGAKCPRMEDSLPKTPTNNRAKFDAASFILGGEILNRTNKQTNKQTNKKTVTDITTPCPSACVDNK